MATNEALRINELLQVIRVSIPSLPFWPARKEQRLTGMNKNHSKDSMKYGDDRFINQDDMVIQIPVGPAMSCKIPKVQQSSKRKISLYTVFII
jgi:hypothetical protein